MILSSIVLKGNIKLRIENKFDQKKVFLKKRKKAKIKIL